MPRLPEALRGVASRDERKMLDWKSSAKKYRRHCPALIAKH
jgi:hypothetical protein